MATAFLIGTDTETQGNWIGVYGSLGYRANVVGTSLPESITVVADGMGGAFTWPGLSATNQVRFLLRTDGNPNNRVGAGWFANTVGTVDFEFDEPTIVSIYCVDGDATNRRQLIEVLDLDNAENIFGAYNIDFAFNNGVWVRFMAHGRIRFRFTRNAGANAVFSGMFFDPFPLVAPTITSPAAAQQIEIGTTVEVAWTDESETEDPLQYEGDLWNGSEWVSLFGLQSELTFEWGTTGLEARDDYRIRVRAHNGSFYGPYGESGAFSLFTDEVVPWTPCVPDPAGDWTACAEPASVPTTPGWHGRFWARLCEAAPIMDTGLPPSEEGIYDEIDWEERIIGGQPVCWNCELIGFLRPHFSEAYTLIVTSDDGVRVWIGDEDNETQIIDEWQHQGPTEFTAHLGALSAGQLYRVRIQHYQQAQFEKLKVEWQSASQPRAVISGSDLAVFASPAPPTWQQSTPAAGSWSPCNA